MQTLVSEDLKLDASALEAEAYRVENEIWRGADEAAQRFLLGETLAEKAAALRLQARKLRELAIRFPF